MNFGETCVLKDRNPLLGQRCADAAAQKTSRFAIRATSWQVFMRQASRKQILRTRFRIAMACCISFLKKTGRMWSRGHWNYAPHREGPWAARPIRNCAVAAPRKQSRFAMDRMHAKDSKATTGMK